MLLWFFFFFFFNVYLFLTERERDRAWVGEGQRERETQNPKPAPGSELSAQSPTRGSNPQTVRSWPEPQSDAQPTEPPSAPMGIYFWETERGHKQGRGREREGDTESKAGSRLWTVSREPDTGLKPMNREIVTWVEVGHLTEQPRCPEGSVLMLKKGDNFGPVFQPH